MQLTNDDLVAIWLTLKLAGVVTVILLLLGTPLAWWLTRTQSRFKPLINAVIALPLVLPPTVLGFYLLLALGADGPLGKLGLAAGVGTLAFTFWGLVLGSCIYSLPFVVQPIQNALESIGRWPMETAATLGASTWSAFWTVALPLAKPGFITATVLGFVHTLGEFGVVLMLGGNIPAETRVVSIQIYDHVEALDYANAHALALVLIGFSLLVLSQIYRVQGGAHALRFNS